MSYSGLRPKYNTIKYIPRSADPVNPVEGEVQYADGTVRPEGLWVYKNGAWTPVGSGSGSSLNYILDDSSTFEGSIGEWVAYQNTAQTTPVDGSGGSPNITFARNTSSPLNGTADGLLTKDAADRQGEGISCDFSIDNAYKNRPLKIKFNYAASANFVNGSIDGVTPSDIQVFLLDTTLTQFQSVFPNTLDGSGQFIGEFQASANTDYRLILHIRSTNALAYTLQVDNFEVSPVDEAFIQADSDWYNLNYTTSNFTNFGTVTNISLFGKKQGPDLLIEGSFTPGTTAAGEGRISLPSGLLVGSSLSVLTYVGNARSAVTSTNTINVLAISGLNYVTFSGNNGTSAQLTNTNASTLFTSSAKVSISFRVPIQGWTSGYATPGVSAQNVPVQFSAYKSAGSITANTTIASWTGTFTDSVGAWNGTTGQYTVKIPGIYNIVFTEQTASSDLEYPQIRVNGTIFSTGTGGGSTNSRKIAYLKKYLNVGDVVTVDHSGNATIATNTTGTILSIEKVNDPSAFLNIPKVATIKDVKAANTDGGTFTSGSFVTRTLNTLSDPFGIVSLASNQFTLQPGTYSIKVYAPAFRVDSHLSKLRNITDSSDTLLGQSSFADSGADGSSSISQISGTFSITSAKTFEIQHRCQTTGTTTGFGQPANFGVSETYTTVEIQKLL